MSRTAPLVEACVVSAREADACFRVGAARVELCRELQVGGLTPEREAVDRVRALGLGPVMVLVRSSGGSFRVGATEADQLVRTVASIARRGADGVVVGALDDRNRIDRALLADLVAAAGGVPVTFHRAFDQVPDPATQAEVLVRAGVARVLTSGGAATAWEGRRTLRTLVETFADRLIVLGAGTIRGDHARALVEETGLREIHARASAIEGIVGAFA